MDYTQLFEHLWKRTTMIIPKKTYDNIASFMSGYDMASNDIPLKGFKEWLTYKHNAPNNFGFSNQVEYVFKRDKTKEDLLKEDALIDFLFKLFFEFDIDRNHKGAKYILDKHKEYMRKQLEE